MNNRGEGKKEKEREGEGEGGKDSASLNYLSFDRFAG